MSENVNHSMSLARPDVGNLPIKQKVGIVLGVVGLFIFVLVLFNLNFPNQGWFLTLALALILFGTLIFSNSMYLNKSKGIKKANDN